MVIQRPLIPAVLLLTAALILVWWTTLPPTTVSVREALPTQQTTGIHLRFGHNVQIDSSMHAAALRYAQLVHERSAGQVTIEVFPAQQLGNDHQMVEMARRGELDILVTPTAKMSVPVPAMQYADLPFYFPTKEDLYAMLDGEPGQMLLERLHAIGLVGVTFWGNGFKHFTANRPLLDPQQFQGMRFRTMKSRLIMEQFSALGSTPVPIDFYATRQALADGVVDGQENPLIAIYSMGFHQVQSDLTLSEHAYLGYVFSLSAKTLERLPPDARQLLIDTAKELTPWQREETEKREQELVEAIRASGTRVHTLGTEAKEALAKRLRHIPERMEATLGPALLSLTDELLYRRHPLHPTPITIGLNSDLSGDALVASLAIKRGAQLAIDEINAAGGVLGRPLRLWAEDHRGLPSRGITNLEEFIADPEVVAVLTGLHSPVVRASVPLASHAQMPLLAAWSAAAEVTEHGLAPNPVFRISANDRLVGPYLADYIAAHAQRPVLLYENTLWGRGNQEQLRTSLAQHKLTFVHMESFNRGERDLQPQLRRIREHHPDLLVLVANPSEGREALRALSQLPNRFPVLSHWGLNGVDFWGTSREILETIDLTLFQTFNFNATQRPQAAALAARYRARYGLEEDEEILAAPGVGQSYDLVRLLAMAITQAGSTERSTVSHALEQIGDYDGVIKHYRAPFDAERHDALDTLDYHLVHYDEHGHLIPIGNRAP